MPTDVTSDIRPRQRRSSRDVRAALLEAGLSLLSERDIDALTVDEIVQHAGIAKGSFYSHFQTKEALAACIARDIREDVERRVALVNQDVTDPAERIVRAILVYVRRAFEAPMRARLMLNGAVADFAPDAPLQRGVTADVRSGMKQGRLRAPSLDAAVMAVQGCAYVAVRAALADPTGPDMARRAGETIQLLLRSFGVSKAEAAEIVTRNS